MSKEKHNICKIDIRQNRVGDLIIKLLAYNYAQTITISACTGTEANEEVIATISLDEKNEESEHSNVLFDKCEEKLTIPYSVIQFKSKIIVTGEEKSQKEKDQDQENKLRQEYQLKHPVVIKQDEHKNLIIQPKSYLCANEIKNGELTVYSIKNDSDEGVAPTAVIRAKFKNQDIESRELYEKKGDKWAKYNKDDGDTGGKIHVPQNKELIIPYSVVTSHSETETNCLSDSFTILVKIVEQQEQQENYKPISCDYYFMESRQSKSKQGELVVNPPNIKKNRIGELVITPKDDMKDGDVITVRYTSKDDKRKEEKFSYHPPSMRYLLKKDKKNYKVRIPCTKFKSDSIVTAEVTNRFGQRSESTYEYDKYKSALEWYKGLPKYVKWGAVGLVLTAILSMLFFMIAVASTSEQQSKVLLIVELCFVTSIIIGIQQRYLRKRLLHMKNVALWEWQKQLSDTVEKHFQPMIQMIQTRDDIALAARELLIKRSARAILPSANIVFLGAASNQTPEEKQEQRRQEMIEDSERTPSQIYHGVIQELMSNSVPILRLVGLLTKNEYDARSTEKKKQ